MTYDRWRATHRRVSNLDPTFALLYRKETGNILGEEGGGAPTAIHLFDHGFILENPVHGGGEILVVHVGASEDVFAGDDLEGAARALWERWSRHEIDHTDTPAVRAAVRQIVEGHVEKALDDVLGDLPRDCPPEARKTLDGLLDELAAWAYQHRVRNTPSALVDRRTG